MMASPDQFGPLNIKVEPATRIRGPPPEAYKNETLPRGAFFIANWKKFDDDEKYPERHGSDRDVENMKKLLSQSGYTSVGEIHDSSKQELFDVLMSLKDKDILKRYDCFVGIFMSHGGRTYLYSRGGDEVHVDEIYDMFSNYVCPSLIGKPKIFILNHCRGPRRTAIDESGYSTDGKGFTSEIRSLGLSRMSDTFLCFSTVLGNVSYRHQRNGSVYIEHFCRVFMKWAKDTEIYFLIPKVNENLSATPTLQVCDFQVIFHKYKFYFNPSDYPCDDISITSRGVQHLPLTSTGGASSEGPSMGAQTSTSTGTSKSTSSNSDPTAGSSKGQRPQDEMPSDVPSADEIYSLKENPKGYVYMMNSIQTCEDDVRKIEAKFKQIGYKVKNIPEVHTYVELKDIIQQNIADPSAPLLVFFFGYGYEDNIFIGSSDSESLSYRKFCEVFRMYMEKRTALILFTNTCYKSKAHNTLHHIESEEPVVDTFHLCLKIDGDCSKGSFLTQALLQEFEESGSKEEIYTFTRQVSCKIHELQEADQDVYYTDFRCYGIFKVFYFSSLKVTPLEAPVVVQTIEKEDRDVGSSSEQKKESKEKPSKSATMTAQMSQLTYNTAHKNLTRVSCIHQRVTTKVMRYVFQNGSSDRPHNISLLDYYSSKGMNSTRFRNRLFDEQKTKVDTDFQGNTFDISLLYRCLRCGSHGLAQENDEKWNSGDRASMESLLTIVKNRRNHIAHDQPKYTNQQLFNEAKALKDELIQILRFSEHLFNIPTTTIDQEISDVEGDVRKYVFDDFDPKSFEEYKKLLFFDAQSEILNDEGLKETIKQYE